MEKIDRLKQRYSRVSGQYQIDVVKDEQTGNVVQLNWQRRTDQGTRKDLPGVYCLRTSHKDLDEKTLWHTYTMLTDLEAVFRSLKSELGIRPVFHQVTERVTGHLFISVLAYHLVHSVRYRLKKSQITSSWAQLRNQLEGQNRVTVSMQCKDGQTLHIRKSTRPEPRQQKIYKALEISLHPGEVIKTILNKSSVITRDA
ncbi:transposase [Desulfobacter hydrogenophilus]|uniref:Transposase n=1 Tax=Desulfobacter hydrogenophilus TaxID=2291 RepID=A0A328F8J9_9BACT|nr:transposase [Desulfobacter hydrogenophilus]QBH15682.1 transposase [Desulfobacter hydrogenophilus]RAL99969.1 transposase [Desulfobacter hydrogenophilus]